MQTNPRLVFGFLLRPHAGPVSQWLMATGGILFAIGALFWVWNLWRTFDAADARQRQRRQTGQRELPTMDR